MEAPRLSSGTSQIQLNLQLLTRVYVSRLMESLVSVGQPGPVVVGNASLQLGWNWREVNRFIVQICNTIRAR